MEQEAKEKQRGDALLRRATIWIVVVMAVACLFALAGVVLGAINFVHPTQYPVAVLAAWFVGDVVLTLLILAHIALYVFIVSGDSDTSGMIMGGGFIILVAAAITLSSKHFAWVSICALLFLISFIIIDVVAIVRSHD